MFFVSTMARGTKSAPQTLSSRHTVRRSIRSDDLKLAVSDQLNLRIAESGPHLRRRERPQLPLPAFFQTGVRRAELIAQNSGMAHELGRAFWQSANQTHERGGVEAPGHPKA